MLVHGSEGTGETNPTEESKLPKFGRAADGGRDEVSREDFLWLRGV